MTIPPLAIIGGGGLALLAWQSKTEGSGAPASPVPQRQSISGANMSSPVGLKAAAMAGRGGLTKVGGKSGLRGAAIATTSWTPSPMVSSGGGQYTNASDTAIRQKIHALEAEAKARYDALSAEARRKGAAALNKMNPSPGLTGDEDFAEASKKVEAAVGSTVGIAACNAIPIPGVAIVIAHTACATLGAMIGAYLGESLGKWAKDLYSDVRSWADKKWAEAGNIAEDAGDAVADAAKGVVGAIRNLW